MAAQGWKGVLEVHCSSSTRLARTHNKLECGNSVLLQKYTDLHFLMWNNVFLPKSMYTHSRVILHLNLLTSELLKKRKQPEFYSERILTPTRAASLVEGCEFGHVIHNCTAQVESIKIDSIEIDSKMCFSLRYTNIKKLKEAQMHSATTKYSLSKRT